MILESAIKDINKLFQLNDINDEITRVLRLSGTTSGLVLRLDSMQGEKYILKYDDPDQNQLAAQFLNTYRDSLLLPRILIASPDSTYLVYNFIEGTTHINRGIKQNWLRILTQNLFNKYVSLQGEDMWGRIGYPRQTWKEFNEISIEEAKINIGSELSIDDYSLVRSIADKLYANDLEQGEKFYLHGDTGVHNFVYHDSTLIGVIDPSPMIGPIVYDFLYAFCSSPDDINLDTLFTAYHFLEQGSIEKSRLIEETLIQLYCRLGLSIKHHPNDLTEYKKAWAYWKQKCELN
ncbi:aminoglycoside phosphotransferase family protein [Paenibacillus sp. YSY-4.3]